MTTKKTISEYRKLVPEKLATENDLEYELFSAYCFLGIGDTRKLVKLVPYLVETEGFPAEGLDKYVSKIKACSAKFKWRERAKKFDCRRVVSNTDKLIFQQAKFESDWVDRHRQTWEIFAGMLADSVKIKEANALLIDAAISKLTENPKIEVLVAISKVIAGVANTNATLHTILQGIWQSRESLDSITALNNDWQAYIEAENL